MQNLQSMLTDEMEEKDIQYDNVIYHTMFLILMRAKDVDSVVELCEKMVKRNFVPKTQMVVLLMNFFCKSRRPDLGLGCGVTCTSRWRDVIVPMVVHWICWRPEVFGGWRDGEVDGAQRVDQAIAKGFAAIKRACRWNHGGVAQEHGDEEVDIRGEAEGEVARTGRRRWWQREVLVRGIAGDVVPEEADENRDSLNS
ncbi:hypothetical protein RHSIM_Rhsim05G0067200 [Rhododendron simsii]|uniref:Pentatricopeptide repeat-containing protein n=1 Tax=Rhododendron simsii TaxID=118357 RepID=A0A834LN97_RHOSS|nr:hypothetical protein RHSIM_Rhsim05G0067200 [Rhododendron simsii]